MSKPVTLREFVADSITQIAEGLSDAQDAGIDGLKLFPEYSEVAFDLAVTANESGQTETKTGGGISVVAAVLRVGVETATAEGKTTEASSVSRLCFSVKIRFPNKTFGNPFPDTMCHEG
jgi:hypothetical protein